jgi:hypothetical protein
MRNRIFRTLALGIGLTAILATSGLNATVSYTGKVNIPFDFRVGKYVFNAGDYRVEQNYSDDIAFLVNVKTGQRVQFLHPFNSHDRTKMTFVFENVNGLRVFKKLS